MSRARVCWWSLSVLLAVSACNAKDADPVPAPESSEAKTAPTDSPPKPSEETKAGDDAAPADASTPRACTSDLDCTTCWEDACRCRAKGPGEACGESEVDCARDPCTDTSASCSNGECRLRWSAADPCKEDADCEIRKDLDHCDLYAAAKTAPLPERHTKGCATMPSPVAYEAKCITSANRCVLERKAAAGLGKFELSLSCDMHGTAISNETVVVTTDPPQIRTEGTAPGRESKLTATDLQPLGKLLASANFAGFVAATPKEGPARPGMLRCTLKVASDTVNVAGKTWGSEDTFEPPADAPHQALNKELARLRAKLPPPAKP